MGPTQPPPITSITSIPTHLHSIISPPKGAPTELITCLRMKQRTTRRKRKPLGHCVGSAGPTTRPADLLLPLL